MGVAPSRETLKRGLYIVPPPTSGNGNSSGGHKKLDIVLVPLTKEFFPSADCPLFVQFHKTRCDAGVNYYFRHPGNPGDLSRIPNASSSDGKTSYPSREVLYSGVVERTEEMLFDTDEEMRLAHERSLRDERSGGPSSLSGERDKTADVKEKRVLPIMCAVAFRYDPEKLGQLQQNQATTGGGRAPHLQTLMANGVRVGGSIVNIVGCFGFVPMEVEGMQSLTSAPHTPVCPGIARSGSGSALTGLPRGPHSLAGVRGATSCSSSLDNQYLSVSSLQHCSMISGLTFHDNPTSFPTVYMQPNQRTPVSRNGTSSRVSSLCTTPTYDPYARQWTALQPEALPRERGRAMRHRSVAPEENFNRFFSLPPPVAAPLAAIVFLTKSAGEQNLGRVTFVAASTYYNQLVEAGVLKRRGKNALASSEVEKCHLPPLETFSFSSLMTNVPIISFVYEMRCRWEQFGLLSRQNSAPHSRTDSLNFSSASTSGLKAGAPPESANMGVSHENLEMWLTDDSMFHGRIGKELAERLCLSMAERPDVTSSRAEPLPDDRNYWRFCGLVDRKNQPPTQLCEGDDVSVDPVNVYVMGAAVIDGFDEGGVLRYDRTSRSWVADRNIPLDAVVLAAMRPFCKAARTAPPDDIGWVTTEVEEEDEKEVEAQDHAETAGEEGVDADATMRRKVCDGTVERKKKRVHVREGNFYIYRFELNGKVYYHGTVPDFANPNKKKLAQNLAAPAAGAVSPAASTVPAHPATGEKEKEQKPVAEKVKVENSTNKESVSTISALFSFFAGCGEGSERSYMSYLPTRVRYGAVQAAAQLMGVLFHTAPQFQPLPDRSAVATTSITSQTAFPPSAGLSAQPARRPSTFVKVGPEAEVNETRQVPNNAATGPRTFAKRFIDETAFIWDWRKS
ncbi:uncharacterized protein TEOVI_000421000 [Trypanosoma equiperdum]|uniref:Uncharacterized protein n=1 Tax=Trypanosoma equiperdum TaxID=5694 RepID=A0A1G4IJE1_TRYEQ|nr:hypothetical protein, conserved [Trypanosoma equiperdum]